MTFGTAGCRRHEPPWTREGKTARPPGRGVSSTIEMGQETGRAGAVRGTSGLGGL